ncbi:hypothetical protein LOTGIDRAFT_161064 [Lottia gigantea]|uniref:ZMYM2-like/QRICH1 C-terminal domain-containing protein n=1 Tax=Lottia gigantea TaxID=225164 RepID=V3ZTM3_LOTGI|nr:hypothetical protein LOTGIDRAFT_161064 [Lottia gigantea]ESO94813.1 hypothetical protein LOTGIDRAFT_161064 [Lottia gigantea]
MSGSSDDDIFITQTKTCEIDDYNLETDTVLSDALNVEENYVKEAIQLPKFDMKYSDISDVETPNLPENVKSSLWFSKPLHDSDLKNLVKSGLSIKTEIKLDGQLICLVCGRNTIPIITLKKKGLRSVLNSKMKELSRLGLGINTKKSEVITIEQEEILWSKGLLGESNPQQLLDTLLFLFGLHFALRAAEEFKCIEDVSKTNQGGLDHRKVSPKMTRAYEYSNPLRCPVRLYEKYIALRPKNGIHTIQSTVKRLCQSAGIIGNFSNHSLRATATTRLYQAGVDEQFTGHRSNALRAYKRTSDAQQASDTSTEKKINFILGISTPFNTMIDTNDDILNSPMQPVEEIDKILHQILEGLFLAIKELIVKMVPEHLPGGKF